MPELSREWFEQTEEYRYSVEPYIHSVAQFTRYPGKKILEIGVGGNGPSPMGACRGGMSRTGSDGVRGSNYAITIEIYGFHSELQRADAERLPFPDGPFDLVYS